MNRGAFQNSQVQQMGGNPSWWNMNNLRLSHEQTSPLLPTSSPSSSSSSSVHPQYLLPSRFLPTTPWHENQDLPESWSQLLLGGLVGEDRCSFTPFEAKKMENWEDQVVYPAASEYLVDVKQETSESGYDCGHGNEEIQTARSSWSQILPASSPRSCITTSFSSNMLDFSNSKAERKHQLPDHSSECNSTVTGAAFKKARVQVSSPAQSTFKVRKERLGDRITTLHQLVSPFGKTDTASVLLEATGYIRFLQSQIEVLSSPYLGSGSGNIRQPAQGERSCIFPEDPGQLFNETFMKKRGAPDQDANDEPKRDLRSRGLCLVPVSCTMHVRNDNGADYWAPTLGGGFQ